jgi:hypothetical protein
MTILIASGVEESLDLVDVLSGEAIRHSLQLWHSNLELSSIDERNSLVPS